MNALMVKILFVCMGNICRSPTAEAIFRHLVQQQRLDAVVEVDSAGTHGYHTGEAPDSRTQRAAWMRGYDLSQIRARKVAPQDIEYFDLILVMDKSNLDNLKRLCVPEQYSKLQLFMDYSQRFEESEVPDPYYGLGHGFDIVIDMVEDASQGLLAHIKQLLQEKRAAAGYIGKELVQAARNDPQPPSPHETMIHNEARPRDAASWEESLLARRRLRSRLFWG
jgi:protein-tyrosine phosphatase